MPLEDRLREELDRAARAIDPDVGRGLSIVQGRSRRHGTFGPGSWLVAAAVIVVVVVGVRAVTAVPETGPGASGSSASLTPDPFGYDLISGSYVVTLPAADVDPALVDVAGLWTMALARDGTMRLMPPATFDEGGAVQSGVAFSLAGDRLRTNLFQERCDSIGAYRWSLQEDRLTLTPVDDTCTLRATVLGGTWDRQ